VINFFCVVMAAVLRRLLPRLFRWEVHGLENVPRGPAIIVSNHLSVFDPPSTLMALLKMRPPRHVYFLAKKQLYSIRWMGFAYAGFLLDQIHAIPLSQDEADLTAFKRALKLLGEGKLIGIYPEGGITRLHEPLPPAPGLALLAHHAQVPVIPLGISGTRPLWSRDERGRIRFNRIVLRFGQAIAPPRKGRMNEEARRAYTQRAMDECYALATGARRSPATPV
jgi:1-acyl-sn-glycerol-3-phosphate acyltransferase